MLGLGRGALVAQWVKAGPQRGRFPTLLGAGPGDSAKRAGLRLQRVGVRDEAVGEEIQVLLRHLQAPDRRALVEPGAVAGDAHRDIAAEDGQAGRPGFRRQVLQAGNRGAPACIGRAKAGQARAGDHAARLFVPKHLTSL